MKTPIIQNELINRRKISGAATTARKKLIQAMLENGDKKDLGITGYPAEMSIYRSLLWNTGIHCEADSVWGFHPPKTDDKNEIEHTWTAIEDFLETCEGKRQPVVKLYEAPNGTTLRCSEWAPAYSSICRDTPLQDRNCAL